MRKLTELVPDIETLLEMVPAELAGVAIEQLISAEKASEKDLLHPAAFCRQHESFGQQLAPGVAERITKQLAEALSWLKTHGLIASSPESPVSGYFFVTRMGREVGSGKSLAAFRKAGELPKERMHLSIAERCHAQYIRGEFDSAVFEAYKTLEVKVREAAKLPQSLLRTALARRAPEEIRLHRACSSRAFTQLFPGTQGFLQRRGRGTQRQSQSYYEKSLRIPNLQSHRTLAVSCTWQTTRAKARPQFLLTNQIFGSRSGVRENMEAAGQDAH